MTWGTCPEYSFFKLQTSLRPLSGRKYSGIYSRCRRVLASNEISLWRNLWRDRNDVKLNHTRVRYLAYRTGVSYLSSSNLISDIFYRVRSSGSGNTVVELRLIFARNLRDAHIYNPNASRSNMNHWIAKPSLNIQFLGVHSSYATTNR